MCAGGIDRSGSRNLAQSVEWKKLRAGFETANCVGAEPKVEPTFAERPYGGNGFVFGASFVEVHGTLLSTAPFPDGPSLRRAHRSDS
jgi:hypothetical protein